jgi:hypothetical protein
MKTFYAREDVKINSFGSPDALQFYETLINYRKSKVFRHAILDRHPEKPTSRMHLDSGLRLAFAGMTIQKNQ